MHLKRKKKRKRILYLILFITTIIAGLASRKFSGYLPGLIEPYAGDTLWAMMVFWGFGFLFSKMPSRLTGIISLLFCYAIEISQLYQKPWINEIRNTKLGGLILGYGFLWSDLVCYTIGILTCVLLEYILLNRFRK